MPSTKIILLLLAFLCAFHPSPLCDAEVCYVKPTEPHNSTCPSEPCYTLDEYMSDVTLSRYFNASNTVFMFLDGHHHIDYLHVLDVSNLTLEPYMDDDSVVIRSDLSLDPAVLQFDTVSHVVIKRMTFKNISIVFEDCVDVVLTELTVVDNNYVNSSITLKNVLGLVNFSKLSLKSDSVQNGIEWRVTRSSPILCTRVLLHTLDITGYRGCGIIFMSSASLNDLTIFLTNSNLINLNIGVYMHMYLEISNQKNLSFVSENTLFHGNYVGLYVSPQKDFTEYSDIVLCNVSFVDNELVATRLINVQNARIEDCSFRGSQYGGAVKVTDSSLILAGHVTFLNNFNTEMGGAMSLFGSSFISILKPDSTYLLFENNTAGKVGGAIYFQEFDFLDNKIQNNMPNCQINLPESIHTMKVFNFTMNKAEYGGNAIYGANLEHTCVTTSGVTHYNLSYLILNISSFSPSFSEDVSVVSSNPQKLLFCDQARECNTDHENITEISVYPGKVFNNSVALLGDMDGFVRYPLYVTVNSSEKVENQLQYTRSHSCKNLSYSILSERAPIKVSMTFHFGSGNTSNCVIHMSLRDCPLGFSLNTKQKQCVCNEILLNLQNVTCDITDQTIHRQGTVWIGSLGKNSSNASVVFSSNCPFSYCYESSKEIHASVNSLDEDVQCTGNRLGILCGGCRDGFSLALGSNRCLYSCSNSNLSLIIAFAASGIVLVFFIKILNLTVSQGTYEGLVFYANIVGVEFYPSIANKGLTSFLAVFIAWLNLDLGIETCFFDGMDAYAKAWLQFVFPVYVLIIALFIIVLSRYSMRASQLFGNNCVPVLATIVHLSYSKLLRAVTFALSVTKIHFLNGSTLSVWERDGNVQYLTGKHIPLFVFAVAVLVLVWFPFTLVLISIQWLQRGTHYRIFHWVTKLKPFFDAFTGPFKDKHRYFIGILLLARCSLFLVTFIYTLNEERVGLLTISITVTIITILLAFTGSVYKNFFLTILLLSYLLNLGILSAGALYTYESFSKGSSQTLVTISIGIAFLQFVATVVYHTFVQLKEPLKKLLARFRMKVDVNKLQHTSTELEETSSLNYPSLYKPDYRDSLLPYLTD